MTLEELQEALERIKREEEEICGYELCGNYARCDFCDRGEPLPCANAYLRFRRSPPNAIPAWKLPEPDVGWEGAESGEETPAAEPVAEAAAEPVAEPASAEEPVAETVAEAAAEVSAESAPAEEPVAERKKVLRRGERGAVRLASFCRKNRE